MQISICPKCYEKGKVVKGKFLNTGYVFGKFRVVYHCEECKDSYLEE